MPEIRLQPDVHVFYNELNQWLDDGMPQHKVFSKHNALCESMSNWLDQFWLGIYNREIYLNFKKDVEAAKDNGIFPKKLGIEDQAYPFGGRQTFFHEIREGTVWENKERLYFVRFRDTRPRHLRSRYMVKLFWRFYFCKY